MSKTKLSKKSTKKRMKLKTKLAKKQARLNKKESEATSSEKVALKLRSAIDMTLTNVLCKGHQESETDVVVSYLTWNPACN